MDDQRYLFNPPLNDAKKRDAPAIERFQGAVLYAAVGDALGWPTEFFKKKDDLRIRLSLPVRDYASWKKLVGGAWWGYLDDINAGEYSDDTQLTLAIARSIATSGDFEPERFAYSEFPLWLHYERGGGKSIKAAAKAIIRIKSNWLNNFYKQGETDYRFAGANGAAMRNLPIALVSCNDVGRLVRDSFYNTIISHGHPRAIIGAILLGLAARYALIEKDSEAKIMIAHLKDSLENAGRSVVHENRIIKWIQDWEKKGKVAKGTFRMLFQEARQETLRYLSAIPTYLSKPVVDYYRFTGALDPMTRGSGVATTCVGIYLYLRYKDSPCEAIFAAANQLGSDTDTIASFAGALVGARFGLSVIPQHLKERIQDRDYLMKTALRLHIISSGQMLEYAASDMQLGQREAFLKILAWEIGLHEMFWDAIDLGGVVVHPTLGRGVIKSKEIRKIARVGYTAKLIRIEFDCGQTCKFHSRVENNERVTESLTEEIERALKEDDHRPPTY